MNVPAAASTLRRIPAALAALLLVAASPGQGDPVPAPPSGVPAGRTLDVSDMDSSASPCADFYQYSDGGWLQKNPIPADRPRWSSFDELQQRNQNDLHEILEKLAAGPAAPDGSERRKLGDFYGACMDEAGIEARGISPIEPELARLSSIHDLSTLRAEIGRRNRWASTPSSRSDPKRTARTPRA